MTMNDYAIMTLEKTLGAFVVDFELLCQFAIEDGFWDTPKAQIYDDTINFMLGACTMAEQMGIDFDTIDEIYNTFRRKLDEVSNKY